MRRAAATLACAGLGWTPRATAAEHGPVGRASPLIGSGDGRGERNVCGHDPSRGLTVHGGEHVHDTGSWADGRPARPGEVAAGLGLGDDVGWDPADLHEHRPFRSTAAVERHVLTHAGAGRPYGRP
ncbi:hypothetical protein [Streptomyces sp. NPDC020489]|uniref:hypothetical protein n=1 Tax=Streptomyces sp. NPDC020489 TaxID=3365077 RepID=UPI0037953125